MARFQKKKVVDAPVSEAPKPEAQADSLPGSCITCEWCGWEADIQGKAVTDEHGPIPAGCCYRGQNLIPWTKGRVCRPTWCHLEAEPKVNAETKKPLPESCAACGDCGWWPKVMDDARRKQFEALPVQEQQRLSKYLAAQEADKRGLVCVGCMRDRAVEIPDPAERSKKCPLEATVKPKLAQLPITGKAAGKFTRHEEDAQES